MLVLKKISESILVTSSFCNRISYTWWLEPQKSIFFSQFWRLQVWDEGTSPVGFWWRIFSWLAHGHILTVRSRDLFWVRKERESKFSPVSSCKSTNPIIKAQPSWPSNPTYFPKSPSPDTSTLGVRASVDEFCGDAVQSWQYQKPKSFR